MLEVPLLLDNVSTHSMEHYLPRYIANKIHPSVELFQGRLIVVRGHTERILSIISTKEKTDKLFNWKRPSAEYSSDKSILYINCFPGLDYVFHYGLLIKTYLTLEGKTTPVCIEDQPEILCYDQLLKTNFAAIPSADVVIMGKVEYLIFSTQWKGDGDFRWIEKKIGDKNCLFLGCTFSFWGNIAGMIVSMLSDKTKAVSSPTNPSIY